MFREEQVCREYWKINTLNEVNEFGIFCTQLFEKKVSHLYTYK